MPTMTRREAIERAAVGAGSHAALAEQLGITSTTLTRWKNSAGKGKSCGTLWHWQIVARLALVKLEDIETEPRNDD